MEIVFATLNVVIKLKAYYTCVREMECFFTAEDFSFLSHLQVPCLLLCFFLGFVDMDFLPDYRPSDQSLLLMCAVDM